MNSDQQSIILYGTNGQMAVVPIQQTAEPRNAALAYLISLDSKGSRETMSSFLNIIARLIGQQSLYECNWAAMHRHHVQAVIEMLKNAGRSPSTLNTYLSAMKGVALEAWNLKQIDTDTYQRIKTIKSVKGSRLPKGRALNRVELDRLFAACLEDNSIIGIRDLAIFSVLVGSGMRRSEIVSLDIENIIVSDHSLRVIGKGNKERLVFVPQEAWSNLMRWIEECRGNQAGPLFSRIRKQGDITGKRLSDQAIYYLLEKRQVEAGLEKVTPHDLRRTVATMLDNNGESLATIKDYLGHASINTTQRYIRHNEDNKKAAAGRLGL